MTTTDRRVYRPDPGAAGDRRLTWSTAVPGVAFVLTVLAATTVDVRQVTSTGALVALAMTPVWVGALSRFAGGRAILVIGLLAVLNGLVLTAVHADTHSVSGRLMLVWSLRLVGIVAVAGLLMWARTILRLGTVAIAFGLGNIASVSPDTNLYSESAWKFGYAFGVTLIVLGLAELLGSRLVELVSMGALAVVGVLNEFRSAMAILLLAAVGVMWQLRPRLGRQARGSATRVVLGLAVSAIAVYFAAQALILDGALGEETRQRSLAQIDASGSLITGGRPEQAATLALFRDNPWGFGSGALPTFQELTVAKGGMIAINYDPNNGYVERFMFGDGYELHSTAGDLWAHFGLLGLLFVAAVVFLVGRAVARDVAACVASGLALFLIVRAVWDLAFNPLLTSTPALVAAIGLGLAVRRRTGGDDAAPTVGDAAAGRAAAA